MKNKNLTSFFVVLFFLVDISCQGGKRKLFTRMAGGDTGILFNNTITETDSLNIFDYIYFYNGGGVAVGDFNNDQLPDIYFVSNQGSNKLYLNEGDFHFRDITEKAGVQGKGNWKTGVTLADVNDDGLIDIYVSEVGKFGTLTGKNELFINNGDLTFTEKAQQYGLDVEGFNTQAAFFDYDHDGDLDMFLVNHSVHAAGNFGDSSIRSVHSEVSGDKLFRNNGRSAAKRFTEVTQEAGIYSSALGYGLSVSVGDLNNDGWEDLYVSNDFHENDYYYVNNKNGTFSELNKECFGHESRFSMGSAIADMNNDGWPDIITLDMLPDDPKVVKTSPGEDPLDIYKMKYKMGYQYQYSRNCLQLNTGNGYGFSDIGLLAGIAATDWSWSPLAADFNNDGIKDLFISNGIVKRPNDLDFLKYNDTRNNAKDRSFDKQAIGQMPSGAVSNYIFKGTDSLLFIDHTDDWGLAGAGFSTGAAYADLDNDGDLDIITNNINESAGVFRNNSTSGSQGHYINILLKGSSRNPLAIGSKVILKNGAGMQLCSNEPTMGFESCSLQNIHFGTGVHTSVDSLQVIWPDGKSQLITNIKTDRSINLNYDDADYSSLSFLPTTPKPLFSYLHESFDSSCRHKENDFDDFSIEPLLPHMLSTSGPRLAVQDVNKDGLQDFYMGGAKNQPGKLFIQTKSGTFKQLNQPAFNNDSAYENVNAVFFDADGNGTMDLYVVNGGNEKDQQDRLYLSDGKAHFIPSDGIPKIKGNHSVAIAADIDHDGDQDLFVGARSVTGVYGEIPFSYLLINDGKGQFSVAAPELSPGLSAIGMITDAAWSDINQDGWKDLIIVGEWMPVTLFLNRQGRLLKSTCAGLNNTNGLWTHLSIADVNADDRDDLIVGNWGTNSKLKASLDAPLLLYAADFDGNGTKEQLLAQKEKNAYYPFLGKDNLEKQLPLIRKKFFRYTDFAQINLGQLLESFLIRSTPLKVYTLESSVFLNNECGCFTRQKLPEGAQVAPLFAMLPEDFDHDGHIDLLLGGNMFDVSPFEGRYDAMPVILLKGTGQGQFTTVFLPGTKYSKTDQVRDLQGIRLTGGKPAILE
nr:VCBS repeat-containing protein [Chitinophagaceae bacterium]